jgi:isoquinoline 1-oxidoreductase subunit alpha
MLAPAPMKLTVNGETRNIDVDPDMPLLWALRDVCGLTGTRYGCGRGLCGACTVHLDGKAVRACTVSVAAIGGRRVTTIEGLAGAGTLHPVQAAWVEADVPQCGFCQSGQIMQAAALISENASPTRADVDAAMAGILCRCGTYTRIRRAIEIAVQRLAQAKP